MQLVVGKSPTYIWIQIHVGQADILEPVIFSIVCVGNIRVFCFFNMQRLMENGFMIYIKTYIGHIILMTLINWFGFFGWICFLKPTHDLQPDYMQILKMKTIFWQSTCTKKVEKLRKYLFWKNCLFNEKQNQHHLKSRFTAGNWFTELHCCISYAIYLNENEYNRLQTY